MNKLDRPFLIGEKVYLRPLDMNDVNPQYLHWVNDEEVIKNLAITRPSTIGSLESFVMTHIESSNFYFFAIIEKETNKHIGNIKIGPINWTNRTSNFGIMLGDKSSWGKGYANDSFKLIFKYSFMTLNLNKLWDIAVGSNIASIKSLERSGAKVEANLKEHSFKNGKYEDCVVVSITAKEFINLFGNDII